MDIPDLARQLGAAIAADERCVALKGAIEKLSQDDTARDLEQRYNDAAEVLQEKNARGEPIEPEEKRAEAELRDAITNNATIMEFIRLQADFHALMQEVQHALDEQIGLDDYDDEEDDEDGE